MRHALTTLALALTAVAGSTVAATPVTLFKSPWCGCCESYARYLRNQGFEVKTIDEEDMDAVKKRHGTDRAASCHTSLIGGYVIEGHVPAQTIRKLLAERPQIAGISLPGMPASSPGMGPATKGSLQIVRAQAPMAEMLSYQSDLTSMTQGRGSFSMEFSHYDYVPALQVEKIVAAAKAAKAGEEEEEE